MNSYKTKIEAKKTCTHKKTNKQFLKMNNEGEKQS